MKTITLDSEALHRFAQGIVKELLPLHDAATVVTLSGELGAGKTTFAQGVAKALGVEETVSSPTFVIEKIYQLSGQQFEKLIHIDAYRLKNGHELDVLGWKEIIAEPKNLIVLEWPERVAEVMPENTIKIRFDIEGDTRIITINGGEETSTERNGEI